MAHITIRSFDYLENHRTAATLTRLYRQAFQQGHSLFLHFLPRIFQLLGKGIDWKSEDASFYDDKYVPSCSAGYSSTSTWAAGRCAASSWCCCRSSTSSAP